MYRILCQYALFCLDGEILVFYRGIQLIRISYKRRSKMKTAKRSLSLLLSVILIISMFTIIPLSAAAEVTTQTLHFYVGDESQIVPITDEGVYTVTSSDDSIVSTSVTQPYVWNTSANSHVETDLPVVTSATNLFAYNNRALVKSNYYDGGTQKDWVNSYESVTIPIKPGDKLDSYCFGSTPTRNGIRVTYFSDDAVVRSYSPADIYNQYTANNGEYIVVPTSMGNINAVNVPAWTRNSADNYLYIVNAPDEAPAYSITPESAGTATVTVEKDGVPYARYEVTVDAPVENESFDLAVGDTAKVILNSTGNFDYSYTYELPGTIEFVEPYEIATSANSHLSAMPALVTSETNLYAMHVDGYYNSSGTWQTGFVDSVTIPVHPGDKLAANSFKAAGENNHSDNGIRVTYFSDDTKVSSKSPAQTYTEYSSNGYLTVPSGVNAVNVSWWTKTDENYLYILNAEADPGIKFTATKAGNTTVTVTKNGYDYGVYRFNVMGEINLAVDSEHSFTATNPGLTWTSGDESVATVSTTAYVPNTSAFNFSNFGGNDIAAADLTQYAPLTSDTNLYPANHINKYAIANNNQSIRNDVPSVTIPVHPNDRLAANSMGAMNTNGSSSTDGIRIKFLNDNTIVADWVPATTYNNYKNNGYVVVPAGANTAQVMYWSDKPDNYLYILNADGNPVVAGGIGGGTTTITGTRNDEVVEEYTVNVLDLYEDWYTAIVGTDLTIESSISVSAVSSSRPAVATASVSNDVITVRPAATGDTTVTVTYAGGGTTTFDVYVYNSQAQYDYLKSVFEGKKISILGDSISTLDPISGDYGTPRYFDTAYYPNGYTGDATISITHKDTYWGNILRRFNATLGVNEAYRGTKVTGSGDTAMQSDYRIGHLDDNGTPDVIFFYGGTNDHNNSSVTSESFTAAYENTLTKLASAYPDATVICLLPVKTYNMYNDEAAAVCTEKGIEYIDLQNTSVTDIHPLADGFSKEVSYILDTLYDDSQTKAAEVNGVKYATLQAAVNAAYAGDTVKLLSDVNESIVIDAKSRRNRSAEDELVIDLNGNTLTNSGNYHTLFIKKGAVVTITDSGEGGTIDNVTSGYAAIVNNGELVVESGNIERSAAYYNGESDYNSYYTVWNRGDMTINGGTFTAHDGRSSLIDNGWNASSYTSSSNFRLADGTTYKYGYSEETAYENPTLTINGGTLTGGHHVVNNDMYGHLTVNGGTLTQNIFSPQVFSAAIYNTGAGAVTEINDGTITCVREDEEIPAEYGITHFDEVHYFAIFTTNENATIGDGSFSIEGGTINGRIGAGSDYPEWVATFRRRPGQAEEVEDSATLSVSGGSFDRAVPAQYCADGYVPSDVDAQGRYTVEEAAYVAEVNDVKYTSVQEAIDAAGAGDTVKLLADTTESVVIRGDDTITFDLNGNTLTNEENHHTVVVLTGGYVQFTDSSGDADGQLVNTTKNYATLFNNGFVTVSDGTFTRTNATEDDTYYVVENHGALIINGGTFDNSDNCRASLIDNGYANYESSKTYTTKTGDTIHYGYVANEGLEHPTLTINGGTFLGGRHVINNDVKGQATINDGSFTSTTSDNATYSSKADVVNNIGTINITGGTFTCVGNSEYVLANIVNQDTQNATPVRIAPDMQTAKYSDGVMNVTGGTFNGKLYSQTDAQNIDGKTADMNVSGGSFDRAVPDECCADGYVPSDVDANDKSDRSHVVL